MKILLINLILLSMLNGSALAGNEWYRGEVSRVALTDSDGSFVIRFKNDAIADCLYNYVYFTGSKLGEGRLKHAYTMALTSLTTGLSMGTVIDKSINGVNGKREATGITADLRNDL